MQINIYRFLFDPSRLLKITAINNALILNEKNMKEDNKKTKY